MSMGEFVVKIFAAIGVANVIVCLAVLVFFWIASRIEEARLSDEDVRAIEREGVIEFPADREAA